MRYLTKEEMKAVSGGGCRVIRDNYNNVISVECDPPPPPPPPCDPYSSAWHCNN